MTVGCLCSIRAGVADLSLMGSAANAATASARTLRRGEKFRSTKRTAGANTSLLFPFFSFTNLIPFLLELCGFVV